VIRWPDPQPHDIAEVWDNAAALAARTCQRCGMVFAPRPLLAHPDDEQGAPKLRNQPEDQGGGTTQVVIPSQIGREVSRCPTSWPVARWLS
jgi:hypothetical protein